MNDDPNGWALYSHGLVGQATLGEPSESVGAYVASYDPEANDGRGWATFTRNPAEAMLFGSPGEALACWQSVPRSKPLRADGRPNRPLTAFTMEIRRVTTQT